MTLNNLLMSKASNATKITTSKVVPVTGFAAQYIHFENQLQTPYLGTNKSNYRILISTYTLTKCMCDFSVLNVLSFVKENSIKKGV